MGVTMSDSRAKERKPAPAEGTELSTLSTLSAFRPAYSGSVDGVLEAVRKELTSRKERDQKDSAETQKLTQLLQLCDALHLSCHPKVRMQGEAYLVDTILALKVKSYEMLVETFRGCLCEQNSKPFIWFLEKALKHELAELLETQATDRFLAITPGSNADCALYYLNQLQRNKLCEILKEEKISITDAITKGLAEADKIRDDHRWDKTKSFSRKTPNVEFFVGNMWETEGWKKVVFAKLEEIFHILESAKKPEIAPAKAQDAGPSCIVC